uniref:Calx-beta domain-containing protein n=1 Tax=Vitrella brassicaformis TaxID=1169539 RepID=A0A7S1JYZ2_9ALVE
MDSTECPEGIFLPVFGDAEQRWPNALRAVLYLAGNIYMFLGIAIVADIFMGSIEVITSSLRPVVKEVAPGYKRRFHVKVWNDTVANLTLMALGSSAPEILLSVIEIYSREFYTGQLGPSTIVGSAAFNLLVISAVCIMSIPAGEIRKIKDVGVYAVTASASIFAYLWLLIILKGSSPDVVEPWEGVLTFIFFPMLVTLAFMADKGYFTLWLPTRRNAGKKALAETVAEPTDEAAADVLAEVAVSFKEKKKVGFVGRNAQQRDSDQCSVGSVNTQYTTDDHTSAAAFASTSDIEHLFARRAVTTDTKDLLPIIEEDTTQEPIVAHFESLRRPPSSLHDEGANLGAAATHNYLSYRRESIRRMTGGKKHAVLPPEAPKERTVLSLDQVAECVWAFGLFSTDESSEFTSASDVSRIAHVLEMPKGQDIANDCLQLSRSSATDRAKAEDSMVSLRSFLQTVRERQLMSKCTGHSWKGLFDVMAQGGNDLNAVTAFKGLVGPSTAASLYRTCFTDNGKPFPSYEDAKKAFNTKKVHSIYFAQPSLRVSSDVPTAKVKVKRRSKNLSETVGCSLFTKALTAKPGRDFVPIPCGTLSFNPGDDLVEVEVHIPTHAPSSPLHSAPKTQERTEGPTAGSNYIMGPDGDHAPSFQVVLAEASEAPPGSMVMAGSHTRCTVTVERPEVSAESVFAFLQDTVYIREDAGIATFAVHRFGGCEGYLSCHYHTEDGTAKSGMDYEPIEGELCFAPGECIKHLFVPIIDDPNYELAETFRVIITDAEGGATFDPTQDGFSDRCIAVCHILSEDRMHVWSPVDMLTYVGCNIDALRSARREWKESFISNLYCNGSPEDQAEASCVDWILHIIAFPWKMIFSVTCPPTSIANGYLCFVTSLAMIGLVTAIVQDLSSFFGCVVGVPDEITAISIVALGTSLPDTFASKAAAQKDPYADASIGNITGSNSVNVFLGLGLPWMIASFVWSARGSTAKWKEEYPDIAEKYPDGAFAVPAGSLGFSVMVFTILALACIVLLAVRRSKLGGELGGPKVSKLTGAAILVSFWVAYLALSSLKSTDTLPEEFDV